MLPPKHNAASLSDPAPAVSVLAVFKAPPVAHTPTDLAEFHSSDDATTEVGYKDPPAAKARLLVPNPATPLLGVDKSLTSAQLLPLHSSVFAVTADGLG